VPIRHDYLSEDEVRDIQEHFLSLLRILGSDTRARKESHIDGDTLRGWKERDTLGFKARYQEAKEEYADLLEGILHEHIMGLKPGQNILGLIFRLKAETLRSTVRSSRSLEGERRNWLRS
jgi:hypothetical protein